MNAYLQLNLFRMGLMARTGFLAFLIMIFSNVKNKPGHKQKGKGHRTRNRPLPHILNINSKEQPDEMPIMKEITATPKLMPAISKNLCLKGRSLATDI